ncbi:MAG: glycosyltransferase [Cyclobacteriaceae bacterium]|nr:glycosyltransferase [Cyclobacteriaceae bacterium]
MGSLQQETPLLSVCLITYNHSKYIRDAIESVLMQKVNFGWELIIADDCSTDGTREIVLEYYQKYPGFIKLILQEKNVGPNQNFFDLLSSSKSKYIAYLEGDDYWTDPLKLQKQVDFLELNPIYTFCFHYANNIDEKGELISCINQKFLPQFELDIYKSIIKGGGAFPSSSLVFRRYFLKSIPDYFWSFRSGDSFLIYFLALFGPGKSLPFIGSVYRAHSTGIYSSIVYCSDKIQAFFLDCIQLLNKFNEVTNYNYDYYINKAILIRSIKILKSNESDYIERIRLILSLGRKIKYISLKINFLIRAFIYLFNINHKGSYKKKQKLNFHMSAIYTKS